MNKKPGVTRQWLPLIFLTVLDGGVAMAERESLPPDLPVPRMQEAATPASGSNLPDVTQEGSKRVKGVGEDAIDRDNDAKSALQESLDPVDKPAVAQEPGAEPRFVPMLADLAKRFPDYDPKRILVVDATAQRLLLVEQGKAVEEWVISTASKGLGSEKGSDKTPLGVHRIAEKIGDGAPLGTIFKARQNTGEIVDSLTAPDADSKADYVTSRILWLDGMEPGKNKGGDVDSRERYIYIHGTGEEGKLGKPASHGCIRMRNHDVIDLFDRVDKDTLVVITQQASPQP